MTMKKWILVLGVVMLLIGVSLYVYSGLEKPKINENSFTVNGTEYISKNIFLLASFMNFLSLLYLLQA